MLIVTLTKKPSVSLNVSPDVHGKFFVPRPDVKTFFIGLNYGQIGFDD